MMRRVVCAAVSIACGLIAAPSAAQSLGDLARQEEARRATTTKKAVKSFSNADLAPSEIASPAPAVSTAVATPCDPGVSKDKCPAPEDPAAEPVAAGEDPAMPPQVEADWRRNAEDIRKRLVKARADFDAVSASAGDESRIPGDRAAAERVAAQHQRFIERLERQWQRFEKQAQELDVPTAWIEPRPILSTRTPQ
jgi:hypothetical protein